MKGQIGVESEQEKGSTFWFTAKLEEDKSADATSGKQPEEEKKDVTSPESLKILLAEDNAVNQKVAVATLKTKGVNIEVAENGKAALEKYHEDNFDIFITDLMMPEMDGFNATMEIRKYEKANNLNPMIIIAMTASVTEEVKEKSEQVGIDDYLTKPFKPEDIDKILKLVKK